MFIIIPDAAVKKKKKKIRSITTQPFIQPYQKINPIPSNNSTTATPKTLNNNNNEGKIPRWRGGSTNERSQGGSTTSASRKM